MKLDGLSLEILEKAISIYWGKAYSSAGRTKPKFNLAAGATSIDVLQLFNKEVHKVEASPESVRYTMRLGNRNYPFMKLLLQEHLLAGEFFFAVDTHDEMEIKPDFPDYEAWNAVRHFNSVLKREIEAAFATAGLETAAALRRLVVSREHGEVQQGARSILVVDDEEDLCDTVATLLQDRGYAVQQVHDGRAGLQCARDLQPHLILLDYEMPELDGLEVLEALSQDERTAAIPVILTTASRVTMEEAARADGFLAKPFHEDLLYEIVDRVLQKSPDSK